MPITGTEVEELQEEHLAILRILREGCRVPDEAHLGISKRLAASEQILLRVTDDQDLDTIADLREEVFSHAEHVVRLKKLVSFERQMKERAREEYHEAWRTIRKLESRNGLEALRTKMRLEQAELNRSRCDRDRAVYFARNERDEAKVAAKGDVDRRKTSEAQSAALRVENNALRSEVEDLNSLLAADMWSRKDYRSFHDDVPVIESDVDPSDHYAACELTREMDSVLSTLTLREERVLRWRYYDDLTLDEVGELIGRSREQARQIQAIALRKISSLHTCEGLGVFHEGAPVLRIDEEYRQKCPTPPRRKKTKRRRKR